MLAATVAAQQPSPPGSHGMPLAVRSMAAQTGGAEVADVALAGTITLPGGTSAVSGAITLRATADGQSQVTVSLPGGQLTESRDYSHGSHAGAWTGTDGASHDFDILNVLGPHPAWFYPGFVMKSGFAIMTTQYAAGDLGPTTWNGAAVEHLEVFRLPSSLRFSRLPVNKFLKQMTQHDIYVDSSTLLPVAMTFNVHLTANAPSQPFVPAGTPPGDYVEEIRYANYQQVQGHPVAFHIQVYFNGALAGDIQLASASFNTGAAMAAGPNAPAN
jgi:hypothetical protein